jgi:hypothetical protein
MLVYKMWMVATHFVREVGRVVLYIVGAGQAGFFAAKSRNARHPAVSGGFLAKKIRPRLPGSAAVIN